MKGWMFLQSDGQVDFRTEEFIGQNMLFFQDNQDTILRVWRFDTEDMPVMKAALEGWRVFRPINSDVQLFCSRIGLDVSKVKAYADSIRQQ